MSDVSTHLTQSKALKYVYENCDGWTDRQRLALHRVFPLTSRHKRNNKVEEFCLMIKENKVVSHVDAYDFNGWGWSLGEMLSALDTGKLEFGINIKFDRDSKQFIYLGDIADTIREEEQRKEEGEK